MSVLQAIDQLLRGKPTGAPTPEQAAMMSEEELAALPDPTTKRRTGGLMGALEGIFAPEPGSFMHSAYNNTIYNAKAGQQQFRQEQMKRAIEQQMLERQMKYGETKITPRGDAIRIKPDGDVEELYRPSPQPQEMERLYGMWANATDPLEKAMLAQMLRGYNFSPFYMRNKADEEIRVKEAVPGYNPLARRPAAGSSSTPQPSLPPGFIPDY